MLFLTSKNVLLNENDNISIGPKKVGNWVSLCCTVGYKRITVMISVCKKDDSERRQPTSQSVYDITY